MSFALQILSFEFLDVKANPNEVVYNLNTGLNYTSIQEAIDASETLDGHTILVDPGTYYERIRVYKSLQVFGDDSASTIIDGGSVGSVVNITADNVYISRFTVRNSGSDILDCGIFLDYCTASNISHNVVTNCRYGIYLFHSHGNTVTHNNVSGNYEDGIWLYYSGSNVLIENKASNNRYNFGVFGGDFSDFNNTINTSNTVDEKPIQYLMGVEDSILAGQKSIGTLYLINCSNMTIKDLNLTRNGHGLFCWNLTNSRIENVTASQNNYGIYFQSSIENTISHSYCPNNWVGICLQNSEHNIVEDNITPDNEKGISLYEAENNILAGNTIFNNLYGIRFFASSFNEAYHNNLIENTEQVNLINSYQNVWDDGLEGNFWSDHNSSDANKDGLRDSSYIIDTSNRDYCPLLGKYHNFKIYFQSSPFNITVISNSTISNFSFESKNSTIKFVAECIGGTQGFCRVAVPHALMNPDEISVTIDNGQTEILHQNYTLHDDDIIRCIYFVYQCSAHEIIIAPKSQSVIPLPLVIVVALLAVFLTVLLTVFFWKRKLVDKDF